MAASLWRRLMQLVRGERRHSFRLNAERVQVTNRQYEAAVRLARHLGTTPEDLFDYRRADRILGERR